MTHIGELTNVQLSSPHHLYWPDLAIDVAVESIDHPEQFPLVSKVRSNKPLQRTRKPTARRWQRQRADFLVDNVAVDVKTSVRGLKRPTQLARKFVGNRVDGVSYAMVEFMSDGARVSLEGESLGGLSWRDVERMWAEWRRPLNTDRCQGATTPTCTVMLRAGLATVYAGQLCEVGHAKSRLTSPCKDAGKCWRPVTLTLSLMIDMVSRD